jgi:hypothetical protein
VSLRLVAIASFLCFAGVVAAKADEQILVQGQVSSEVLGVEASDAFASRVRNVVAKLDFEIVPSCAQGRVFELRTAASFAPNDQVSTKLAEGGKIVWLIEVTAKGCSADRLHNLYVFPRRSEPSLIIAGFPGKTQAGLDLQVDAQEALTQLGPQLVAGCATAPIIIDTRLVDDTAQGKPWTEEWSLRVCNTPTRVRAIFTPSATGVSLNIETL